MSRMGSPPQRRRSSFLAAFSTVRTRRVAAPCVRLSPEEHAELAELASHHWKVVFMAPLWGVQMNNMQEFETQLSKLKRLVKLELDEMPEHRGMTVDAAKVTSISQGHLLPVPCIRLTVCSRDKRPPAAELVFCSEAGVKRTLPASCVGQCVWLPLVLVRGSAAIREVILARLRAVYGSTSASPGFTQDDLRWMASMWAGRPGSDADVTLEYHTPEAVAAAGLRSVTLRMPAAHMQLIWGSVHDASQPEMSRESMDKFHRVLAKVADDATGLPLGAFDLARLVTPLATVHADGRIQFTSADAVDPCLSFLRQLAREFFDL